MPFAGISYRVKPGNVDAIASIFSPENFQRVDSPFMYDDEDEEIGVLICTGLFLSGDTIVRVIQHEGGSIADIRRHMSVQEGVHEAERKLMPYLVEPRDTETPEGFMAHFDCSTMTVLDQQQTDNRPAAGLLALSYRVVPGSLDNLALSVSQRLRPAAGDGIIATLLLAREDVVVRVVQYDSRDEADAIRFLARQPLEVAADRWLAPYLADGEELAADLGSHLQAQRMTSVSHLSAAIIN